MSADELSLEERGLVLRGQLQAQRREIAQRLAPGARSDYPRSVTMRVLLAHPELLTLLVTRVAGARFAGRLHVLLIVFQALRSFAAIRPPAAAVSEAR